MFRPLFRSLPILLLAALCGCGFRLAGTTPLPQELNRIYLVTSDFDRRQQEELLGRLRRAGADVSLEPAAERVKLSVRLRAVADQRVVTSAGSGESVERVTRNLDFSLRGSDDRLLVESRTLSQQSDVRFDEDNLLSSSEEKDIVVENLEKSLYDQLIRQLQSI
jgi:outer membrane lipopolysaccharide assembly protein LptE/RlpB